jgi:hypothetical protein
MKAALIACVAATPAFATCPTGADLREGVVLVQNEPTFLRTDVEVRSGALLEVRLSRDAEERATVRSLTYVHALAPEVINETGTPRLRVYDPEVTRLDRLDDLGDITFRVTERDEAGEETETQVLFNHVGTGTRRILDCTYDTWKVREMTARAHGEITTRELDYAPALGLVLAASEIDAGGDSRPLFSYTWIGTAADVAR